MPNDTAPVTASTGWVGGWYPEARSTAKPGRFCDAMVTRLGCRVCAGQHKAACPANIAEAEANYAAQRMVNLMGAWHSQLIEMLGAMGLREIRRLRGEVGRAMFQEDLERDAFKDLARGLEAATEVAEPDRQPVLSEAKEQAALGIHR